MRFKDKYLEFLLITICIQTLHCCETYQFVTIDNGKALEGHVIKTVIKHLRFCWSDCVWLPWCFSINIRQTGEGMFECELNNSSKKGNPSKMAPREGWSYNEMKQDFSLKNCKTYECKMKKDLGNGWFRYGDSAIKLFTEKKNWTDARSHCQSLGGDLLSITSSHENDFVNDVFIENLNLTYVQEDKKLPFPYVHFKLNGDESDNKTLEGDRVDYKIDGREKALYLNDGQPGLTKIPSMYPNPAAFTLLFWVKPLEPLESAYVLRIFKSANVVFKLQFESSGDGIELTINYKNLGKVRFQPNVWQYLCVSWNQNTTTVLFGKDAKWIVKDNKTITSMDTLKSSFRFGRSSNVNTHGFYKHLVLVNSTISKHEIQTFMYWHEQGVWIGLNNPEGSDGFSWSDGTPVGQFMNLPDYNPEPKESGRKCVAMAKDKKWLDKHCYLKYPFLCEKPAPP